MNDNHLFQLCVVIIEELICNFSLMESNEGGKSFDCGVVLHVITSALGQQSKNHFQDFHVFLFFFWFFPMINLTGIIKGIQ